MKPFLIILVVVVLLALLAWVLMRGAARKREEQRVEAARIRAAAQEKEAQLRGQEEYSRQFHEREAVARAEAEKAQAAADEQARLAEEQARVAQERAGEVSAIEAERTAHEEVVAEQRSEYEAELGRADEIDPDVKTPGRHAASESVVRAGDNDAPASALDEGARADAADIGRTAAVGGAATAAAGAATANAWADDSRDDATRVDEVDHDAAADIGREAAAGDAPTGDVSDEAVARDETHVVSNIDDCASTEPLPLDEQSPPQEPDEQEIHEDTWDEDPVGEPREVDPADARAHRDPESSSHDEGEHAVYDEGEHVAYDKGEDVPAGADAQEASPWGRRIAGVGEIRDGGYGVGSAAPFPDGAMPQDHPVQAYHDTMTYRTEDSPGYDSTEPDVWFYDEFAAERAGFQRSQED